MPKAPLRNLAQFGVITDVDPYDLPLGAWSMGVNVRFQDGRVQRGPVWRAVDSSLGGTSPRYVAAVDTNASNDTLYIGYLNGTIKQWSNGSELDVTHAAWTPSDAEAIWSHCSLAGVTYINRADRAPWGIRNVDTTFQSVTGWDPTHTCRLLRAYAGALVALNVTKAGVEQPNLVKTSDIVTDPQTMPPSWDHTDPSTNAVENTLTEMAGPIIDAAVLGDALIIYGSNEAWVMEADGSDAVYRFRKLRYSVGAINANCAVEVDGKHYVFGPNDIVVHDGYSKTSIVDKRVRRFIFRSLNLAKASRFFVVHNQAIKTIHFCFVSGDAYTAFPNSTFCNRSADYDYANDRWTFSDLPLVSYGTLASPALATLTYDTVSASYETIGGAYQDLEDGQKKTPYFVGEASATFSLSQSLYAFDLYGGEGLVNAPVDENATAGMTLERDGIDLDELNESLSGYKIILSVQPEARVDPDGAPLMFSFGASDFYGVSPAFSAPQSYRDNDAEYKLDFTDHGRYLSMRITYDDYRSMSLSGFDLELETTGER